MSLQKKLVIAVSAVVVMILVGGITFGVLLANAPGVFAQGPVGEFGPGMARGFMARGQMGPGQNVAPAFGMGPRRGGPTQSLVAVAAEQLGLSQQELAAELQAGKTIADVAAEKGVSAETIVEAFLAPRAGWLAEQVSSGQLTQEQADAMLAAMRANVTARLSQSTPPAGPGYGPGYTDQDGDGVCDNFVDEDGDGVCDNAGSGGYGPGYTDEDGDGVCDYAGSRGRGGRMAGRWMQ